MNLILMKFASNCAVFQILLDKIQLYFCVLFPLTYRWPAKAQASLGTGTVSPEPSLFAHIKYGRRQRVWPKIKHLAQWMAAHARLKNDFTEDEKYHNPMRWLIFEDTCLALQLTSYNCFEVIWFKLPCKPAVIVGRPVVT